MQCVMHCDQCSQGPRGVVRASDGGPDSHGFCLLNNISIAAAYAMNRHRDRVKRVAIVDFEERLSRLAYDFCGLH